MRQPKYIVKWRKWDGGVKFGGYGRRVHPQYGPWKTASKHDTEKEAVAAMWTWSKQWHQVVQVKVVYRGKTVDER